MKTTANLASLLTTSQLFDAIHLQKTTTHTRSRGKPKTIEHSHSLIPHIRPTKHPHEPPARLINNHNSLVQLRATILSIKSIKRLLPCPDEDTAVRATTTTKTTVHRRHPGQQPAIVHPGGWAASRRGEEGMSPAPGRALHLTRSHVLRKMWIRPVSILCGFRLFFFIDLFVGKFSIVLILVRYDVKFF